MATTCTFKSYTKAPNGITTEASGTVDLEDVTVNSAPNSTGGWTTALVAANLQPQIYLNATDAATAGTAEGWYQKVASATFRKAA